MRTGQGSEREKLEDAFVDLGQRRLRMPDPG
jgi:hypothetical protein